MDIITKNVANKAGINTGKALIGYDLDRNRSYVTTEDKLREDLFAGWRDLRAPLIGAKVPASSAPDLISFGPSGGIYQHRFAVNDEVYLAFHIDHDIKIGSTVYPHVHWASDGALTDTVKWEFEYTVAKRTDAEAFPAPTIIELEEAPAGVAWAHQVTEDATGFTAPEVDSLVIVRLARITNGATENADDVFGLFCDLHYETDRYATPSRAPDYYTVP